MQKRRRLRVLAWHSLHLIHRPAFSGMLSLQEMQRRLVGWFLHLQAGHLTRSRLSIPRPSLF